MQGLERPGVDGRDAADTREIHRALEAKRAARGMDWRAVADEIGGVSAVMLAGLAKGRRGHMPALMRIIRWLDRPAAEFVRVSEA